MLNCLYRITYLRESYRCTWNSLDCRVTCSCSRVLVVLHQQYGESTLLRSVQRQLPSNVLAYPDLSLVWVETSKRSRRSPSFHRRRRPRSPSAARTPLTNGSSSRQVKQLQTSPYRCGMIANRCPPVGPLRWSGATTHHELFCYFVN